MKGTVAIMNGGGGSKGLSLPRFSKSKVLQIYVFFIKKKKRKKKNLKTRGVF